MKPRISKVLAIMSVLISFTLTLFLGQVYAGDMWKKKPAPDGASFKIGHSMCITGPASDEVHMLTAAKDYADRLNEKGGIHGVPVKVLWADNKYQIPLAIKTYKRWKEEGILTHKTGITGAELALKATYAKDKIPSIPSGGHVKFIDPPGWIFQPLTTSAEDFAGTCIWFKNEWKKKGEKRKPRLAVLYPDNTYGRSYKAGLNYVKHLGIELVGEFVVPWGPIDTTATMYKVLDKKPDFVYLRNHAGACTVIYGDMRKTGLLPRIPVIVDRMALESSTLEISAKEAEGVMAMSPWGLATEDLPGIKIQNEWYEKRHGKEKYPHYNAYYNSTYGMMKISCEAIKRAYEKVGWPVTGQDVYDALCTLDNFDMGGLIAPVSFTGKGMASRRGISKVRLIRVHNAKLEPVSDWIEVPLIKTDGTWTESESN